VPSAVTIEDTSNSTHVARAMLPLSSSPLPVIAGLVVQVIPVSDQPFSGTA
jgi:hypothetical protein